MDKAAGDFIRKITEMTGMTLEEIELLYRRSGLTRHSELRAFFMAEMKLGYGFANTLAHVVAKTDGASLAEGKELPDLLSEIYSGRKEHLRPVHDAVMRKIEDFGDFDTVPKKGYLSLKRKRQFAMIGPKTNTRIEIGINMKGQTGTDRLIEQPKGGMCQFIVKIESADEVDAELISWLRAGYGQSAL